MSETFSDKVEIKNSEGLTAIELDANQAMLDIRDRGNRRFFLIQGAGARGSEGHISIRDESEREVLRFNPRVSSLYVGVNENAGNIIIRNDGGTDVINLNGGNSHISLRNNNGSERIRLDGASGSPSSGEIVVRNSQGHEVIFLNGGGQESLSASLQLGGNRHPGSIKIRNSDDRDVLKFVACCGIETGYLRAVLSVGAERNQGVIAIKSNNGNDAILLDGGEEDRAPAALSIGGNGSSGDLKVLNGSNREMLHFGPLGAALEVGTIENAGNIYVKDNNGNRVIHLNGGTGEIISSHGDVAEHFDAVEPLEATPGTLMVLNQEGKLEPSSAQYDKRVVGVVTGAGGYKPGIVLDHKNDSSRRIPISMLGKASCKADAAYGPIEIGDLLTTSPTIGHAMKASDPKRAFGSVIGKSMSCLIEGRGLIDMLISLQ